MVNPHPCIRSSIKVGMDVSISMDKNDHKEQWIRGDVVRIETPNDKNFDENGIVVRIDDGTIGHIKEIHTNKDLTNDEIIDLIRGGETAEVEFKETFQTDIISNKKLKKLMDSTLKPICAFMNTRGGHVFIGVDDRGNITGLERDYQHVRPKRTGQPKHDKLIQEIGDYIQSRLKDKTLIPSYKIGVKNIQKRDICIIRVERANKKVFVMMRTTCGKCGNEFQPSSIFYIRDDAASVPLDPKEIDGYFDALQKQLG